MAIKKTNQKKLHTELPDYVKKFNAILKRNGLDDVTIRSISFENKNFRTCNPRTEKECWVLGPGDVYVCHCIPINSSCEGR